MQDNQWPNRPSMLMYGINEGLILFLEVDPCTSILCYNGGTCMSEGDVYRCMCAPEYFGPDCSHRIGKAVIFVGHSFPFQSYVITSMRAWLIAIRGQHMCTYFMFSLAGTVSTALIHVYFPRRSGFSAAIISAYPDITLNCDNGRLASPKYKNLKLLSQAVTMSNCVVAS